MNKGTLSGLKPAGLGDESGDVAAALLAEKHSTTTVVNTSAESDLCRFIVPSGLVAAGDVLRFSASGDYLNNSGGAQDHIVRFYIGATAVLTTPTQSPAATATRRKWLAETEVVIESTSAERIVGLFLVTSAATADSWGASSLFNNGHNTAAVSMTGATDIALTVDFLNANASLDMRCFQGSLTWARV